MNEIRIISSQFEGAELRRQKQKNRYYNRCAGKNDQNEINEALAHRKGSIYTVPASDWERIFGKKNG